MSALPVVREISDGALLARFPAASDREANHAAIALAKAAAAIPGVLDPVPGARSLLLLFEPAKISAATLTRSLVRTGNSRASSGTVGVADSQLRIPVFYGADAGPDLPDLARACRLSEPEFAARHAGAEYEVAFLGFSPGFGYLAGLPESLGHPRLATPRTRVPAGSVAIGGAYTGVYPQESPGGWRLIGRTPVRLFDPAADPPALLSAGTRVRFEPIGREDFDRALNGLAERSDRPGPDGTPILRVESAGAWTTVQGAPRHGWSRWGVPPGGALDPEALAAGNRALGNDPFEPALEISLVGPELEVLLPVVATISGAPAEPVRNGRPVAAARAFGLARGDRLRIGALPGNARAYLCLAGGIARPPGAVPSIRLSTGDVVCASARISSTTTVDPVRPIAVPPQPAVVRVVLGPDEDRFSREGVATFLSNSYRVSAASDRRGIRLEGPPVSHSGSADVAPEGTPLGGVQVAGDGQPIVLGPDRPLTGGYARIATVIGADFPLVARLLPGSTLHFRSVRISEAVEARSKLRPLPVPPEFPSRKERV